MFAVEKNSSVVLNAPEEPSVTSLDPEERKLARRLRIQRRQDALHKQGAAEDEEAVEESAIEKQIFASSDLLEKLEIEADEVITCVKVANDAREVQRRREEQEMKKRLMQKLQLENDECMKNYREITAKWPCIFACNDPLDIHAEMEAQNNKCLEILGKKDNLIAELKEELKVADLKYEEDKRKQNEDINILIERIENQINIVSKAYRRELLLIDTVIEAGRKALLTTAAHKWEMVYEKFCDDTYEGVEKRKQIMQEYEKEMEKVMISHQEEFRAQKIKLELENQRIQQEVQFMKAVCLMNTQKLKYSYAVLKLREDENAIVKGQQKRRINKLQDTISSLKKKCTELEENSKLEIQKLTHKIIKLHKNILELHEKSNNFTLVNERKFTKVWELNMNDAKGLIQEILAVDKVIHEETLGLAWQHPNTHLLTKEDLPSYRAVMAKMEKEKLENATEGIVDEQLKAATTTEEIHLEKSLIKRILKQISDQSGYLIENNLRELLLPYAINDNVIVRLDNIFRALNVASEDDIDYMLDFFLPYSYCATCNAEEAAIRVRNTSDEKSPTSSVEPTVSPEDYEEKEAFTPREMKLVLAVKQELHNQELEKNLDVCFTEQSSEESTSNPDCSTEMSVSSEVFDDDTLRKGRVTCEKGHLLEIEASYVTRAFKEFLEKHHRVIRDETTLAFQDKLKANETVSYSRNLTSEDISKFWQSYRDIFPVKSERLWDALLVGLRKYYDVLKERHQLNGETETLRRQNAELRRLLKSCTTKPA